MQGRRCRIAAVGGLALAILASAAPAWAGTMTASRSATVVTIQTNSSSDPDAVDMALRGGQLIFIGGLFGTNTDVNPGGGCSELVTMPDVATDAGCGTGVTRIVIRTGGGNDEFSTDGRTGDVDNVNATIDADLGAGDDLLSVQENTQAATAVGGAGSDRFFTGPAADHLEGDAGADLFSGGLGSDEILGGPDLDFAAYDDHTGDLLLDLDGVRDDGDPAIGESDLLQDIESVSGGTGDDVIVGDDGINTLEGDSGADRVDGRGGFDRINGEEGADSIFSRDGLADTVNCADGADIAFTDDVDIVFDCEDRQSIPDLQPDRDGDGVDKPLDCNDLDGTSRPGAFDRPGDGIDQNCDGADAVDTDRDRDGFPAGFDCDDARRDVHPGAREKLGNRVDEDCDKVADPFAAFPTVVLLSARITTTTDVVGLVLVDLDGRERVRITCKGRGCRFKTRRARAGRRADSLVLDKLVRGLELRPGARLSVRVTRRDGVRKTVTFTARPGRSPKQRTSCKAPGGGRVAKC